MINDNCIYVGYGVLKRPFILATVTRRHRLTIAQLFQINDSNRVAAFLGLKIKFCEYCKM